MAALIAAAVSILGSGLTFWAARWQVRSKLSELEQAQLKDVLAKRMEAYPRLWHVLQARVSNWRYAGKPVTGTWARELFDRLNACHAKYGVFFSEPVYRAFFDVRRAVGDLVEQYGPKDVVPAAEVAELDALWSGKGQPGLAGLLKDDLGSYRQILLRHQGADGW